MTAARIIPALLAVAVLLFGCSAADRPTTRATPPAAPPTSASPSPSPSGTPEHWAQDPDGVAACQRLRPLVTAPADPAAADLDVLAAIGEQGIKSHHGVLSDAAFRLRDGAIHLKRWTELPRLTRQEREVQLRERAADMGNECVRARYWL